MVLIFAGINFRAFRSFCPKSPKFVPTKYSILLKPRKLIPAKKIEKSPLNSWEFSTLVTNSGSKQKIQFNFVTICFFLHHLIINWPLILRFSSRIVMTILTRVLVWVLEHITNVLRFYLHLLLTIFFKWFCLHCFNLNLNLLM